MRGPRRHLGIGLGLARGGAKPPPRLNYLRHSENISAGLPWEVYNITVTSGQSDPLGGSAAQKVDVSGGAAVHQYLTNDSGASPVVGGSTYTWSEYFKPATNEWILVNLINGVASVYVDLANGVFGTQSGTIASKVIVDAGGGWRRVGLTYAAVMGTSNRVVLVQAGNNSAQSHSTARTIYRHGAQLVPGSSLTPYVTTTTTRVT